MKSQKEKEKRKNKLGPKKLKQILNKNKTKPIEIRTKVNKIKKMQISKTHSMENISNKPKNTTRVKSSKIQKLNNNSMEDLDYLNFSEIDIDFYKKNSSFEEDIFNPKYYIKNKDEKKQIVQNRYNMDTSFDTIKTAYFITESGDDYIDINKNILLKTPSTICNYYDKSEVGSEIKNKNKNNNINKNEDKKIKYKKIKNKSIQIPNNNLNNNILYYNQPINSNRTNRVKPPKTFSSSNIKLTQNNNNYSHTKNNFYKSKGNTITNFMGSSKRKNKEDISSSVLKKRNKEIKNNIYSKVKNQNNLMKNYLKNNIVNNKNKNYSNNNIKKKSFSTKNYSGNITSQIIQNNKIITNCNFTYNNDISNLINKKTNIQNLLKSTKDKKEEKSNINNNNINNNQNNINYKDSPNQEEITLQNNKCQNHQQPIMLCLDKSKFNSYFVTPNNSNSEKKENEKNSTNSNNDKDREKDINNDFLDLKIKNNITENYTGRNNPNSINNMRKDIIVKRKKLNKTNNNINSCNKSINSNININVNTNETYSNYQNDKNNKPIIKVNLKKHIKSSSELIKFINVDIKNKNNKNKKNNKSFLSTCNKGSINTSQVVKDLLNKKKILKSPLPTKNNNTLKTSKTVKENNNFMNKTKTTPKYNKIHKGETFSTIEKKNYIGSNQKGYYALKYELNLKNNNNSNINKNKCIKNSFKPKTQSDIKINKYNIKEDEYSKKSNKENKDKNYDNKENKENKENYNNEYGMDKRVKQKLLDRMNKVSKNNFGYIWGCTPGAKINVPDAFKEIMKSPNKENIYSNNNYYNKKIISNENSKNEDKDLDIKEKKIDKRNQKEITIIKEYKASKLPDVYI